MPAPSVLADRLGCQHDGAGRLHARDLGVQVLGPQVEMDRVLAGFAIFSALQRQLHALAVARHQGHVRPAALRTAMSQDRRPEGGGALQVGAVQDHDEFAV